MIRRVRSLHLYLLLLVLVLLPGVRLMGQDDAEPTLRQLADARGFRIGAAVDSWDLVSPDRLAVLTSEFNTISFEYEAKMCIVMPQEGEYDFTAMDRIIDFAEANGMSVRGHTLVWHECFPSWLEGRDLTRAQAIEVMRDYITTVVTRYRGRIAVWDVVNEAIRDDNGERRFTPWQEWIGDDYIRLAFESARAADPDAKLYYNDYSAEVINQKSDGVYILVKSLVMAGAPIDGIGLQSHFTLETEVESFDFTSLERNMNRLATLGLTIDITEMDVRHDGAPTADVLRRQATFYGQYMAACVVHPACDTFITWGIYDGDTWLRQPYPYFDNPLVAPLLFDDELAPKPAYFAVRDALARTAPPVGLSGTVRMAGRSDYSGPLLVELYQGGTAVQTLTVTSSADGSFSLPDVAAGDYTVWLKHAQMLAVVRDVTLPSAQPIDFGQLTAGDVDDSNRVDLTDFSILSSRFNSSSADAGYDARADLNSDGAVTLVDFSLLSSSFNTSGTARP